MFCFKLCLIVEKKDDLIGRCGVKFLLRLLAFGQSEELALQLAFVEAVLGKLSKNPEIKQEINVMWIINE